MQVPARAFLLNGSHRNVIITNETTARDLSDMVADKIGMGKVLPLRFCSISMPSDPLFGRC